MNKTKNTALFVYLLYQQQVVAVVFAELKPLRMQMEWSSLIKILIPTQETISSISI